jgi:hypothetical protein
MMGTTATKYTVLNSTHFEIKFGCDKTCETCRITNLQNLGCQRFPGSPFSVGYTSGNLPEIKPNGFLVRMHNTEDCSTNIGVFTFVTDRICQNAQKKGNFLNSFLKMDKKARSNFVNYNIELKQAEVITFDDADCSGNAIQKQFFPLGKCVRSGPAVIQIEKP